MTRRQHIKILEAALVQAIIDNDLSPDGPVLSERFWELLKAVGNDNVERRSCSVELVDSVWREKS